MKFAHYHPPAHVGLDILHQDEHLLVVNKPAGLLTTPGRGIEKQDCLVSRVKENYRFAEAVHRLDMATSGLVIIALDKLIHREMSILFQQRMVNKSYIAIVEGIVSNDTGTVDLPMITDWPNRPLQKIDHDIGKAAKTYYKVLERDEVKNWSRLELFPKTGRTHQLRLHMKAIGHAIIGDNLYSTGRLTDESSRLLLHANSLEFIHPTSSLKISITSTPEF